MDADLEALLSSAKSNLARETSDPAAEIDIKATVKSIPKLHSDFREKYAPEDRSEESVASSEKYIKPVPQRRVSKKKTEPETAGKNWFDLGKPEMTPELKRDLQLLKMRHVLDPKRFYKKVDEPSKYFAVGTIQEDPTEFFSNRLTKKERKSTLAEEVLSTRKDYFKSKYRDIQKTKTSGRRKHQKKLRDMRA